MKSMYFLIVMFFVLPNVAKSQNYTLAKDKPSYASSTHKSTSTANAFDGNSTTSWNSGGRPPAWISVDLQGTYSIFEIALTIDQAPDGETHNEIFATNDMVTWEKVDEFKIQTKRGDVVKRPLNIKARGIKISTIAIYSWVAWFEIEIKTREEEAQKKEAERQEAVKKANLEARRKANRNKALWKLGNQICCENENGIYSGTIDQWNEDKSRVKIIIVSGPSTTFEGQKSEKGSAIWVDPSKWHLCLEEDSKKSLEEDNSKPSVSSNSNGSNPYKITDYNLEYIDYDDYKQQKRYYVHFIRASGSKGPRIYLLVEQSKARDEEYNIIFFDTPRMEFLYRSDLKSIISPSINASSLDEAVRISIREYMKELNR